MNNFDLVLLVLAGALVVLGVIKGLVRILIGIAALVAAFALAARYHRPLADRLSGLELPDDPVRWGAYIAIFLGVMLVGGLLAHFARRLLRAAMLGWADRVGGAALGLVAATLLAALLILPLVVYVPQGRSALEGSLLAPYVTAVADLANRFVPHELALRYRSGVEDLRRRWRGEDERPTLSVRSATRAASPRA